MVLLLFLSDRAGKAAHATHCSGPTASRKHVKQSRGGGDQKLRGARRMTVGRIARGTDCQLTGNFNSGRAAARKRRPPAKIGIFRPDFGGYLCALLKKQGRSLVVTSSSCSFGPLAFSVVTWPRSDRTSTLRRMRGRRPRSRSFMAGRHLMAPRKPVIGPKKNPMFPNADFP